MNIKITHFEDDCWDSPSPNLKYFIEYWQKKINGIPEEFRDSAEITIEPSERWGSEYINVEIFYYRTETIDEKESRCRKEDDKIKTQRDKEIEELKRLQNKYPDYKGHYGELSFK